ncbi:MAG: porin [Deltaproteobacteria bacterium]|nr:porin [Deltaproteobacteria bacterium]
MHRKSLAVLAASLTLSQLSWAADVKFGGLADVYYQYNFNRPAGPSAGNAVVTPARGINGRFYDSFHNQPSVNLVELSARKTGAEAGFQADFDFGQIAEDNSPVAGDDFSKHLGQGFITYAPSPVPGLKIAAGKMAAHMGFETYKASNNWNYSRSNAFGFGVPRWHTGVAAGYAFMPEMFESTLYYYNGWNTNYKTEAAATVGAKLAFSNLADKLDIAVNLLTGPAAPGVKRVSLYETNATYKLRSDLLYGADFLYGEGKRTGINGAKWWSAALYHKCGIYRNATLSPRLEMYEDKDAFTTGTGQSIKSATLTHSYLLADGLDFRMEGRYDWSSQPFFNRSGFAAAKNVTTFTLVALYGF